MLTINDNLLQWANITENQLLEDIALMLYQNRKLSFGQASQTAKLNYAEFQFLLGRKQIPVNYGVQELMEDVETIKKLNQKNGNH